MSFIRGALDKEIRLSFAQRIRGTLPDPYQDLITEGKEKDIPDFKYATDSKFLSLCECECECGCVLIDSYTVCNARP